MNTLALPATGAALGDYEQMTARGWEAMESHTRIGNVGDPALDSALKQFELALTEPLAVLNSFTQHTVAVVINSLSAVFEVVSGIPWIDATSSSAADLTTGQDDAVAVLEGISQRLGVPARDALKAAGISRSTFYSWKASNDLRPRLSSQGRLWELAQAVEDLDESLGGAGLRTWLLADKRRLGLLRKGAFDALLRVAAEDQRQRKNEPFPAEYVGAYAVGDDREPATSEVHSPTRIVNRRKVTSVPVRGRADRRLR